MSDLVKKYKHFVRFSENFRNYVRYCEKYKNYVRFSEKNPQIKSDLMTKKI